MTSLPPQDAPLTASPKLSYTFPGHVGALGFYAQTCHACRSWSYEIYQRTLSGKPYCTACLNKGHGLEEIETLVKNINIKMLDELSTPSMVIDQASDVV